MYDLSIIIPHFNIPAYLRGLLQTVPARENVQVIVIDDKSTKEVDEYLAVKSDKAFSHVTFIDNNTDKKGAGASRNIGLQHAKGKWLLFADADDLFADGYYETVERYFESEYDIVFFVPESIIRDTMLPSKRHTFIKDLVLLYHNSQTRENEVRLRYKYMPPWSKMIRNDFVKSNGIQFPEVLIYEDTAFSVTAGYYMKAFITTQEVIYHRIVTADSLTDNIDMKAFDIKLNQFIWRYKYLYERLNKEDFRYLDLCGLVSLFEVIKYKFGFKKLVSVLRLLRENEIPVLSPRFFNPAYIIKRLCKSV